MRHRLHGGGRVATVVAMTLASTLGGCWVVLGESFTDYTSLPDASLPADASDAGDATRSETGTGPDAADAAEASIVDAADASTTPHLIDGCLPSFVVSNGIAYPEHAPGPIDVTGDESLFTDDDPRCGTNPAYCLILASSFHIASTGHYGTSGKNAVRSRPLVIMAVNDITIDQSGVLDLAGGDNGSFPGAGDHGPGAATGRGGGGGNAEPGGGNACGDPGGPTVDIALVPGGNGGGGLGSVAGCDRGGSGGGAVQLVSLCGKITIKGTIEASGGGGGADATDGGCPDGRGGGAGGTVWIQAGKPLAFDQAAGASINLGGGGGGGGSCRPTAGDPWTAGTSGNRGVAGGGGICGAITGGAGGGGGMGGVTPNPPANGAKGVGGGETACGGGGGARGRLILQTPGAVCQDVRHNGQCDLR
jgi:hypothetical protein